MFSVSKQISLSSKSASMSNAPLNSSCFFEIPNIFKRTDNIKLVMIGISHAEIPVSFYIVNDTNNNIIINRNNTGEITYTLTNGNYNGTTFKTMLLNTLGANWSCVLNTSTGKYTLTHSINSFYVSYLSSCASLMGFYKKGNQINYYSIYNTTTSSFDFLCPYACNLGGTSRINIKSTTLLNDNLDSIHGGHSGTLATISNNAELFGIILYNNTNNFRNVIYNDFLNAIDISITDDQDKLVNFNGVDWYLTIQLDIFYNSTDLQSSSLTKLLTNS
jgi:hypothetical protein